MDLDLLERTLAATATPAFRTSRSGSGRRAAPSATTTMTNLPRALRETLAREVPFSTLTREAEQRSKDGTVKTLFQTADGHPVEAVLMRYRDGRRSVCVSSQSGAR